MKTFILTLFATVLLFAQETEFKFTKDGFTDFVVINVDGKTPSELYKKTIDWISFSYKNPKEVIKAQIENDYIRFEGFKPNTLCPKLLGMSYCLDVKYQIEVSFKEGKYKFDVTKLESYNKPSENRIGGYIEFPLNNPTGFFKPNREVRPSFKSYPENLESTFNDLNKSLESFLKSDNIPTKKDDW
ncbi:MAG: DUF4468 domain-containing protein [Solirubrobacteraceae bacterium]